MLSYINSLIFGILGDGSIGKAVCILINIAVASILASLMGLLVKIVLSSMKSKSSRSSVRTISAAMINRKFPGLVTFFFLCLILSSFSPSLFYAQGFIYKLSVIGMLALIICISSCLLNVLNDFYMTKDISLRRPIKGPLQVIKIVIALVISIIIISTVIGQNPVVLLSGIGASTAILSIVFKDALLGLVAGIQITSDNLIQIGDWISIPSDNLEGSVTDISLITVKVTSMDNLVYTVPAYTFLSTPFKNWHATLSEGVRLGTYSFTVDPATIKDDVESGTNLTHFREDFISYLKAHENVISDRTMLVRSRGGVEGKGVIVDIFFATDITDYEKFCGFMSSIGEKAISDLQRYGLKAYRTNPGT